MTATYTDATLPQLVINRMTKNQYDSLPTKSDNELYIITDDDSYEIQVSTMPTANLSNEGRIVQYIGTTTASYTSGYWYKCVGEGSPIVYSWVQIDVQPAGSSLPDMAGQSGKFLTNNGTDASWTTVDALPSQSGQSGKFLTTDGTDASWASALQNTATQSNSLAILGSTSGTLGNNTCIGSMASTSSGQGQTVIGQGSQSSGSYNTIVGRSSSVLSNGQYNVIVGCTSTSTSNNNIIIGPKFVSVSGNHSIQLSTSDSSVSNSDSNTFKVANNNGNYEIMSADGTVPADRLVHAINKYSTMPTAAAANEGWIVQYTGVTDSNYTHGYIYECISDGELVPTYSWSRVNVQPNVTSTSQLVNDSNFASLTTPSTTPTLTVAGWNGGTTQTITVQGVTATNAVFVSPAPLSAVDYATAGVICTTQNTNSLTFSCNTTPTNDIDVSIVILG